MPGYVINLGFQMLKITPFKGRKSEVIFWLPRQLVVTTPLCCSICQAQNVYLFCHVTIPLGWKADIRAVFHIRVDIHTREDTPTHPHSRAHTRACRYTHARAHTHTPVPVPKCPSPPQPPQPCGTAPASTPCGPCCPPGSPPPRHTCSSTRRGRATCLPPRRLCGAGRSVCLSSCQLNRTAVSFEP